MRREELVLAGAEEAMMRLFTPSLQKFITFRMISMLLPEFMPI